MYNKRSTLAYRWHGDAAPLKGVLSSPYRTDPTYGLETRAYDGLNRVTTMTHPDSNTVQASYGAGVSGTGVNTSQVCSSATYGLGFPTLSVDEVGMKHETWADGLGRTIEADEADSSGNLTLNTCYKNDLLGNLTEVDQGSQTRTYAYDGLSRKTSETTPEAGSSNFNFTNSSGGLCVGNPQAICRRTSASITTTYSYDAENRLTSKTHSDSTPAAIYFYDESSVTVGGTAYTLTNSKGRLSHTTAASGNAMTIHSYDAAGRTQDLWQCTPFNCSSASIWNMHYSYNLGGDVTSWSSPAGYTITNTITNAQRISQISSSFSNNTHPATLATVNYAPQGAPSTLQNGCVGTGCTQRQETYDYNNRLQPVRIQLGTSTTQNANSCLVYNYYSGVANPTSCAIPSQATSGNDGSVMGHFFQDTTNSSLGHTATYTYDNTNRLATSVATGSSTHNLTFSYDRYGNMSCVTNAQTNGPCPNWTFNTATNQISTSGYTYSSKGNLTGDGTHTYQWDAENRVISVDTGTTASYTYNALDERVEKQVGTAYTEVFYDESGEPVGENSRTSWMQSWVSFAGKHIVHYVANDAAYFIHSNRVGSTGQVTNWAGTVTQDQLYYPWGQEWSMVGTSQENRFAGLRHRDSETSLDPTHFRMFSSGQGRWFSPDPVAGGPSNPQTFNLYAYVGNSPTHRIDPKGNWYCDPWFDPWCYWGWGYYGYYGYCDPFVDPYCGYYNPYFTVYLFYFGIKPPLANCTGKRNSLKPDATGRCAYTCTCGAGFYLFRIYTSQESYLLRYMVPVTGCKDASQNGTVCPPGIRSVEINIGGKTSYSLQSCSAIQ